MYHRSNLNSAISTRRDKRAIVPVLSPPNLNKLLRRPSPLRPPSQRHLVGAHTLAFFLHFAPFHIFSPQLICLLFFRLATSAVQDASLSIMMQHSRVSFHSLQAYYPPLDFLVGRDFEGIHIALRGRNSSFQLLEGIPSPQSLPRQSYTLITRYYSLPTQSIPVVLYVI